MRKSLFYIILFIFYSISYAQDINQFDSSGNKTGLWKEYRKELDIKLVMGMNKMCTPEEDTIEVLACEGFYKEGKKNGKWILYTPRGQLIEITMNEGNYIGPYKYFIGDKLKWIYHKNKKGWFDPKEPEVYYPEDKLIENMIHDKMINHFDNMCTFHCKLPNKAIKNKAPNE